MTLRFMMPSQFRSWFAQFANDAEVIAPSGTNAAETLRVWKPEGIEGLFCPSHLYTELAFGEDRIPLDPTTDVVFDAGCGTGLLCAQIASCYATVTYGIDIQQDFIDTFNEKVKPKIHDDAATRVMIEQGDLTKKPLPGSLYHAALSTATVIICNNVKFSDSQTNQSSSKTVMTAFLDVLASALRDQNKPSRTLRLILSDPLAVKGNVAEKLSPAVGNVYVQLERKMETVYDFKLFQGEAEQSCYVYLVTVNDPVTLEPYPTMDDGDRAPVGHDEEVINLIYASAGASKQRSGSGSWFSNFSSWLDTKKTLIAMWNTFDACGTVAAIPQQAIGGAGNNADEQPETLRYLPRIIYENWGTRVKFQPVYNFARMQLFQKAAKDFASLPGAAGVDLIASEKRVADERDSNGLPVKSSHFQMVATSDIPAGTDVYAHSKSIAYAVVDGIQHRVCAYCLKHEETLDVATGDYDRESSFSRSDARRVIKFSPRKNPVKRDWKTCSKCRAIHYCSQKCKQKDASVHGQHECALLSSADQLSSLMTAIQQFIVDVDAALDVVGKVYQNICVALRAKAIHRDRYLIANLDERAAVERKWVRFIGDALARILSRDATPTLAAALSTELQYWYGMAEMNIMEMPIENERSVKAVGVSVPACLMDHDCGKVNSSLRYVQRNNDKPVLVIRAATALARNEVLKTQYIEEFYRFDVRLRQSTLLVDYCFCCTCDTCLGQLDTTVWPFTDSRTIKQVGEHARFEPSPTELQFQ